MVIYGTALLSLCLIGGILAGRLLGLAIGVDANVGGVGIAMLMLIVATDRLQKADWWQSPERQGIGYWSSIYIPIVVAMAASQNVVAAVRGGRVALAAGVLAVVAGFGLVPLIDRLGASSSSETDVAGGEPGEDL